MNIIVDQNREMRETYTKAVDAVFTHRGRIYGREEIEEACSLIEDIFGKSFFKKGIEQIKDQDPSGAGMGREYCGNRALKLVRAWHRVREELAFGGMEDYYRPGRFGSLIGSLGEDVKILSGVPGSEAAVAGLIDDNTFETTVFLLFLASSFFSSGKNLYFSGQTPSFYIGNHLHTCFSVGAQNIPPDRLLTEMASHTGLIPPASGSGITGRSLYADLPRRFHPHSYNEILLSDKFFEKNPGIYAVVLCNTEFPSGTSGFYRSVSCFPIINEKAAGWRLPSCRRRKTDCSAVFLPGQETE